MLASEVAKLLTFVGSVEGREAATEQQVAAWLTLLEPVEYADAAQAAREHYLNESRRLWPADILDWRDRQVKSSVEDFDQIGLVLSEQLWSNAVVIPAEWVRELGRVSVSEPGQLDALRRRLTLQFQLTERPGEIEQ